MAKLLQTKGITKVYGEKIKTQVLHGIDIELSTQELVSIIGPSGCGKTTLLNIVGTLDSATTGEIYFMDKNIARLNDQEISEFRNENLGFIFQFHHLLPEFTALENVLIPTWIKQKRASRKEEQRAVELLEIVGLKDRINNKATDLSGGQQQRVAIARALINSPKLLLADEPTGNLDSETTEQVYELFKKINKELHTTMLIVTHDSNLAQKSDRIIKMKDGHVVS
ncbi:MAG: ABC transporter ATP-binding protein [Proteocatella sp.]